MVLITYFNSLNHGVATIFNESNNKFHMSKENYFDTVKYIYQIKRTKLKQHLVRKRSIACTLTNTSR